MSQPQQERPWRTNIGILERMERVERLTFAGKSQYEIAAELHCNQSTVSDDLKRIRELWLERIADNAEVHRAEALAALRSIEKEARIHAAHEDHAVAALNTARMARMNQARLLGLRVERVEVSGKDGVPLLSLRELFDLARAREKE